MLVAGRTVPAVKTCASATYHRGLLLGRNDATNVYSAWAAGASDGTENIRAVVIEDRELSAEGKVSVYVVGSEINKNGLVDSAGVKLTVTNSIIELAQDAGIVLK